jgi:hypothetical protein
MNFDTLYKNRPYLFEIEKDVFEDNNEILIKICKDANLEEPSQTAFVASNYDYDAYRVVCDGRWYYIKYSFDANNTSLKHEHEVVKNLKNFRTAAPIKYNKIKFGDPIHYSISSFEFAENVKNSGLCSLFEHKEQFLVDFGSLQNGFLPEMCFDEYLEKFLKSNDLNSFPDEAIESIKSHSSFDKINQIIEDLKKEILFYSKIQHLRKEEFCHGDLKPSNILFRGKSFDFIDFDNSFKGNRYFDLASLVINIGVNQDTERQIFNFHSKNLPLNCWSEYKACYEVAIRKTFLEMLISYLKEVYIFSSFRPIKILEMATKFSNNNQRFSNIPSVLKSYEFIYKTMFEPIIGQDQE